MDKTVPAGAAYLLEFIGKIEAPQGYDTIYGNNQKNLAKPVTRMTLAEVQAAQPTWTKLYGSSATGRYQFMYATLKGLIDELGLNTKQKLDSNLQDRLAYHLLRRRGYDAFVFGRIDATEFGKRLAQEWASFPVLKGTKGAHRNVTRGQSYYVGDGLNKSLVKPEQVEQALKGVRELHEAAPAAVRVQASKAPQAAAGAAVASGVTVAVASSPDAIKSVTDTITSLQPAVDSISAFAAMGGTVVLYTLGIGLLVGIGYVLYKKYKS